MNINRYIRKIFIFATTLILSVSSGVVRSEDAYSLLDTRIQTFINSPVMASLRERDARGGVYIDYAIAEVDIGPEHPEWAKHRAVAYEKAFVDAQNKFIVSQGVEIASDTVKSLFADGSQEIPPYTKKDLTEGDKFRQLLTKVLAVSEGMLDNKLEEMGIDPKEFESLPPKQRVTKLRDTIEKNAVKKAVGSLVGLFPYRTFEGKTADGQHAIGVVVIYSPKIKQFAYDVLHARGNIEPVPGKGGKTLFDQINKERIYADFGIRRIYDENGYPVLVSFGQWSASSRSQDPRIRRKFERIAEKQARSLADGAIASFLGSMVNFENASTIGSSIEQHFDVDHTAFIDEVLVRQITDTIREKSRSRAKIYITGLQDLYRWSMKHPDYGHALVGVVRVWSPASEKRARTLKNWKPTDRKKAERAKKTSAPLSNKGKTEVIEGTEYVSPSDL